MTRRGWVRAVLAVLFMGALVVGGASGSQAAVVVAHDGPGCTDIPDAEPPVNGTTGALLPAPTNVPDIDPFGPDKDKTSLYQQYGYSGQYWYPYDLGCGGTTRHPIEGTLLSQGNTVLSGAKDLSAVMMMPMQWVNHREWMSSMDPMLSEVATAMRDHYLLFFGPVALVGVGLLILGGSHRRGATSQSALALGWAALVVMVSLGVANYPVAASHKYDQVVTGLMDVSGHSLGYNNQSAADALSGVMTDQILYPAWLQGEFGSRSSATAQAFGPALLKAQVFSRAEQAKLDAARAADADAFGASHATEAQACVHTVPGDPRRACLMLFMTSNDMPGYTKVRSDLVDAKDKLFTDTAAKIKDADPNAYQYVAGHKSGAGGFGAAVLAYFQILLLGPFPFMAGVLIALAFVLIKFVVMMLPGVAVFFLFYSLRGMALATAKRILIAAFAAPIFTALATIDATWVVHTMKADAALPARMLFAVMGTVVLWVASRPVRSMRAMVTGNTSSGHPVLNQLGSLLSSFIGAKEGTEAGQKAAREPADDGAGDNPKPRPPVDREEGQQPVVRQLTMTPDRAYGRPAPAEQDIVDVEIVDAEIVEEGGTYRRPGPYVIPGNLVASRAPTSVNGQPAPETHQLSSVPVALPAGTVVGPGELREEVNAGPRPSEPVLAERGEERQPLDGIWQVDPHGSIDRVDAQPMQGQPREDEAGRRADSQAMVYDPASQSMMSLAQLEAVASTSGQREEEG